MAIVARVLLLLALTSCSVFEPERREHDYQLRLKAEGFIAIDYEIEVFAENAGKPVKVSALFKTDVWTDPQRRDLNEIATSSPGYSGLRVVGASIARLSVAPPGATITVDLLTDGHVSRRVTVTGSGVLITDLKVGDTF